jgi:hypothetical protein
MYMWNRPTRTLNPAIGTTLDSPSFRKARRYEESHHRLVDLSDAGAKD